MYRSLYHIIQPKVEAKMSGVIKLLHASEQSGAIELEKGVLTAFVQGKHTGVDAAKIMFRWVNMAVMFTQDESLELPIQNRLNTKATLDQLRKIDARVTMFKELIGGCDAVFRFTGQQIDGEQQFTSKELSVSFILDGKASIKEAQQKSDMSELDLLVTICRLIKTGLVKEVRPHQPMAAEKRLGFLEGLENVLSDITGPVASVLINDAFQAIGAPPDKLAECDIPHLYSVIAFHLEDDEKEAFSEWVSAFNN